MKLKLLLIAALFAAFTIPVYTQDDVSDPNNSSTAPMVANDSFIGYATNVAKFDSITVDVRTTVFGIMFAQFSSDSSSWDSITTIRVERVNAKNNWIANTKIKVKDTYFRIVYYNGSSPQGTYTLTSTLHYSETYNPTLIEKYVNVYGFYDTLVGTLRAVSPMNSAWAWPDSADYLYVTSGGNVNDDSIGTGARAIEIYYLDTAGIERTDTLFTNGVDTSLLKSTFPAWRVNMSKVVNSGTYGAANTGNINIAVVGEAKIMSYINAGSGVSQDARYTVPLGYTATLKSIWISTGTANSANVNVWKRANAFDVTSPFSPPEIILQAFDVNGERTYEYVSPPEFTELTDIYATAIRNVGSTNGAISMILLIHLVPNE